MEIKAVLFDLDGTLLDTSSGVLGALKAALIEVNFSLPKKEDERFFIGPPMQKTIAKYYGLNDEKAMQIANVFREKYKTHQYLLDAKIYDEIIPLLLELKRRNIKVAVATYKREDYTLDLLSNFDLVRYFDVIHGSDLQGKLTKSDIIEKCLDELNIEKSKTILLGDTNSDLQGALNAHCLFVGVTYGFGYKNKNDLSSDDIVIGIIDKPLELLKIID